jgi:hypothetical protein
VTSRPPLTAALRELVGSFEPDLILGEYATLDAASTVSELERVPLAMTAWGTEPWSEDFFPAGWLPDFDAFRSSFGLPPSNGSPTVDAWIVFTPASWGRAQCEARPETVRVRIPAPPACPLPFSVADDGPFVYATLGTVYNSRRRLQSFIDALEAGGWPSLITVGRTNARRRSARQCRTCQRAGGG